MNLLTPKLEFEMKDVCYPKLKKCKVDDYPTSQNSSK